LKIVAGTVNRKMVPALISIYEQMITPRYVIAMGECAIPGGPFAAKENYSLVEGISSARLGSFFSIACEFLTIVMNLEISAFDLNLIITFRCMNAARGQMEAAINYFLFGVVNTGVMHYGMSYMLTLYPAAPCVQACLDDRAPRTAKQERPAGPGGAVSRA